MVMAGIVLIASFLLITTVWLVATLRANDLDLSSRKRKMLVLLAGAQVVMLGLVAYVAWPMLPPGLSQRAEVAERFMNLIHMGDSEGAIGMIVNTDEEKLAELGRLLANPENQPVSWALEPPNRGNAIHGTAVFPGGGEFGVFIRLTWEWPRARWAVTDVDIGEASSVTRILAFFYTQFIPFDWFSSAVVIVSWIFLILSALTVRKFG